MNQDSQNDRRRFLKGMGAMVALPAFETFSTSKATAATGNAAAKSATGVPIRTGFLYVPNGVIEDEWNPQGTGTAFKMAPSMKPIEKFKKDFQIISKFEHKNGWAGKDGGGDHARANATILTGARPLKTSGANIKLGISIDQEIANHTTDHTRFASLELSCDGVRKSGGCDSGYSCAYQFNLSWRSETTPMAPETNPRLVFERFFGTGKGKERQRNYEIRKSQQKSILDFVMDDAHSLEKVLGRNDQNKLDEYLTGVRDIEKRIEKAERFGALPDPGIEAPDGIPSSYRDHIRLLFDMMAVAFKTDSTRVSSFLLAHDGSNRTFKDIGVSEGHHSLSHHQSNAHKMELISRIDKFYMEQFAYFLGLLKSAKDFDGTSLLHNSQIVYCSGLSDANRHRHNNLPVIVAGNAGGAYKPGKHTNLSKDTPMSNLFVSMMHRVGIDKESFGDSNGEVSFL
ncbi:DUF1552 domain-containing protein [Verrucomicrobia bacterium]|nr:DUF1552 domain-containing protein [Verrucomicrobiota bacterium]